MNLPNAPAETTSVAKGEKEGGSARAAFKKAALLHSAALTARIAGVTHSVNTNLPSKYGCKVEEASRLEPDPLQTPPISGSMNSGIVESGPVKRTPHGNAAAISHR